MLLSVRAILASLQGVYYITFFNYYSQVKKAGELDNISVVKVGAKAPENA